MVKNSGVLIFILGIIFIQLLPQIIGISITAEAAEGSIAASVTITGPPSLIIILPENITYNYFNNLPLNFTSNGDNFWYNLDEGANITITGNTLFSTTEGTHTLYLFANDSGGLTKKNVTFTVDLAAPSPPAAGGGAVRIVEKDFSIDKEEIIIKLQQGEIKEENLTIENIGDLKISMNLENPFPNLIKIDKINFDLEPGESEIVSLKFIAKEETIPDLYIGKLVVNGDEIQKNVSIVIEVETKEPLLDVEVEIPEEFLITYPREKLSAKIDLFNLRTTETINTTVDYIIKDFEQGNEILFESETIMLENDISYIKTFDIPKDIEFERHVLYVRANYEEKVASDSAWFIISKKYSIKIWLVSLIIALITILIAIIILKRLKN